MNTKTLRYIDEAITKSLRGEWFNCSQSEVDIVLNDIRLFLRDRGVTIPVEDNDTQQVTVTFPMALSMPPKNGAAHLKSVGGASKLTEDDVRAIRKSKSTNTVLAKKFSVSDATISAVKSGRSHQHVSYDAEPTEQSAIDDDDLEAHLDAIEMNLPPVPKGLTT